MKIQIVFGGFTKKLTLFLRALLQLFVWNCQGSHPHPATGEDGKHGSWARDKFKGIYQAEVCHLSHASILLIMVLFVVVIPKMAPKFGENNFNFIRVRLGQVRLYYVNFNFICTTNKQ